MQAMEKNASERKMQLSAFSKRFENEKFDHYTSPFE